MGAAGAVVAGGSVAVVAVIESGPLPVVLTARTAYQRLWLSVRPDSVNELVTGSASGVPVALIPPAVSAANTWYLVALVTAVHESAMLRAAPAAVRPATCAGSVNAFASGEAGPVPAALVASTT